MAGVVGDDVAVILCVGEELSSDGYLVVGITRFSAVCAERLVAYDGILLAGDDVH
jgi:hypothetical protein